MKQYKDCQREGSRGDEGDKGDEGDEGDKNKFIFIVCLSRPLCLPPLPTPYSPPTTSHAQYRKIYYRSKAYTKNLAEYNFAKF